MVRKEDEQLLPQNESDDEDADQLLVSKLMALTMVGTTERQKNKTRTSRFAGQLNSCLMETQQQKQQHQNGWRYFPFVDCHLRESDMEELSRSVPAEAHDKTSLPLGMSFDGCRLESKQAFQLLKQFVVCHNVKYLGFSRTGFEVYEMHQLVLAAGSRLTSLELTLRYQTGLLTPLLDACGSKLETLKLNACFALEHRVRVVCLQELVAALLPLKLKSFALTDCVLDDEGMALLTGGLLALKNTLKNVRLETEGARGTMGGSLTWQSVPLLGHMMTELPKLDKFHLEFSDCKRLFQGIPQPTLNVFCDALQMTLADDIFLKFSNVGWSEDSVLQILQASAATACTLSLHVADYTHFVQSERFVYQLATYLPQLDTVTDLTIVNDNKFEDGQDYQTPQDTGWWDTAKQDLVVEALHMNTTLQNLKLELGRDFGFSEHHQNVMAAILQRNRQQRQEAQDSPPVSPSEYKKSSPVWLPSAAAAMHVVWVDGQNV